MVLGLLADGWRTSAKDLGALQRRRNINSPSQLLRTLLIYLTGCSLRETVALARSVRIARLSDTALHKRLRKASPWFHTLALGLLKCSGVELCKPDWLRHFNVRCVDATVVSKPGSKGTDWRLHFSFGLFDLGFEQFKVTGHEVSESFQNFVVRAGDLLLGDRGYAQLNGLRYVVLNHGDFIVRMGYRSLAVYDTLFGTKIDWDKELAPLRIGVLLDRRVRGQGGEGNILYFRVCASKLPPPEARRAQREALRTAKRAGMKISKAALRFHRYVVVATSVNQVYLSAEQILGLYRMRWQIEIAIKRLKSIIGLSELPCRDLESGRAWLYGKLVLALLVQALMNRGQELPLPAINCACATATRKRGGNLWRETVVMLKLVEAVVIWRVRLKQYLGRWGAIRRLLEERPRKRQSQHEQICA